MSIHMIGAKLNKEQHDPDHVPRMLRLEQNLIFDQYFAISQKRCMIGSQLLWNANRNSYMRSIERCYFHWPLSDLSTLNHHIFYMLYRPSHLRNWRILQMWQLSWTQKVLAYRSGHVSQFWSFGAKTLSATNNNFALAAYNHGLASISTISFPITVLINVPHVKLS